jgi:hypothetical protein
MNQKSWKTPDFHITLDGKTMSFLSLFPMKPKHTISIALWAKSRFSGKIQVLNFVTRILNGTIENRVLGYLQDQCGDNGSIKKPFWLTQCWDGIYRFH